MYSGLLAVHSLLRWIVLLTGLAAAGRGVAGWRGRDWTPADRRAGLFFIIALDLQFLIGLILYVGLSPVVATGMSDVGAAMGNAVTRFFLVEHLIGMIAAIALAHVGRARVRKARDNAGRHRAAAIFFGLSLLLILLSIPWPGMPAGRPLLPW